MYEQMQRAVLEGMRKDEARRARDGAFSLRLDAAMGNGYRSVDDAAAIVSRLFADPAAINALGLEEACHIGEIVSWVWHLYAGDEVQMVAWFRAAQPALGARSPRDCIYAGDPAVVLRLLESNDPG